MSVRISAVLIVKNEEVLLSRCLESVKDSDEIIICDTGSTDRTIEIAKQYTDKVYTDFVWCDDYAKARNHAKSKATGDWILSIDADEVLHDFSKVKEAVLIAEGAGENTVACTLIGENNGSYSFKFARLFRNIPEIRWESTIHNHLNIGGSGALIGDVRITFGWSPAHTSDPDRALRMLKHAVDQEASSRNLYYLGREYWYKQDYPNCVETLRRCVMVSKWEAERADAYLIMSRALSAQGFDDDARAACINAVMLNPYFKEAVHFMAGIMPDGNAHPWLKMMEACDSRNVLFNRMT